MKNNKGVTMVALVITVALLLILAGISLKLTLGNNGIIKKTQDSKILYNHSSVLEALDRQNKTYEIDYQSEKTDVDFITYLEDEGIINDQREVNVEKLLGQTLSTGNGTDSKDVYLVEDDEESKKYKVEYVGNTTAEDKSLGEIGYWMAKVDKPSDESIFVFDKTTGAIALKNSKNGYGSDTAAADISAEGLTELKKIVVPSKINGVTVKKIGIYDRWSSSDSESKTFSSPYVEEIVLPDTITEIGQSAFASSINLKKINIPNSVTKIDWCAFRWCTSLKEVSLPSKLTELDSGVFSYSGVEKMTIPNKLEKISDSLFKGCKNLMEVILPSSVTFISSNVFMNCTNLQKLNIPKSVTTMYSYSFINCTNLHVTVEAGSKLKMADFTTNGLTESQVTFLTN